MNIPSSMAILLSIIKERSCKFIELFMNRMQQEGANVDNLVAVYRPSAYSRGRHLVGVSFCAYMHQTLCNR